MAETVQIPVSMPSSRVLVPEDAALVTVEAAFVTVERELVPPSAILKKYVKF